MTIAVATYRDCRWGDAVQVQAMERGHAPKMKRAIKRASGVRFGISRGNFSPFTS